jgi:O-antigen/teichoic acid export membrane protein
VSSTPQHSRTRNFLAGVFSGYVLMIANVAVGLWLTPFSLRFLDREEYAIFTLLSDVLMWLGLLDLGITASLRAQGAQLAGSPDQHRINRLTSTAFYAQMGVVIAVLAVGSALGLAFPEFFRIRADLHHEATYLMLLMVLTLGITMATQTFSALLVANQQIHVDNAIGLLTLIIRSVLTIVLLLYGWGLYSLAIANLVAKVFGSSLAVVRIFRLLRGLEIKWRYVSWQNFKDMGRLGIWFSIAGLAGIVISGLDRIVTAKLVSVETVTTLALTGRIYIFSGGLILLITDTARPMLGQLLGQNKMGEVIKIYRQLFAVSVGSAIVLGGSIWAGNGSFTARWVGELNYGGMALDFALVSNFVLSFWARPSRAVLSAGLIIRPQALSLVVEGALNLGLSILLARSMGVFGIVFSTTIASILVSCWYVPLLTARMFGVRFWNFLWKDVSRIFALAICLAPVAYTARVFAGTTSGYLGAALAAVATGLAGAGMLWFVVFDAAIRDRAIRGLQKVVRSVRAA